MFRKEKGFTLIELLIVIAIIGILAAAILPRFIAFDTDARTASSIGNLSSMRAAIVLYRAKEGDFPANLHALVGTYLDTFPAVMYPDETSATLNTATASAGTAEITHVGGWFYNITSGEVRINDSSTSGDGKKLDYY